MKYWNYLKYILHHKWLVFIECCKEGLIWRGLAHDFSKLLPFEFFAYANKFYGEKPLSVETGRWWQYAWLHHQHGNKHHWNYWVVDQINKKALPMPRKYVLEMLCDWRAMANKFNCAPKDNYLRRKNMIILHPDTRAFIEESLGVTSSHSDKTPVDVAYLSGGLELLEKIAPLWEKLNHLHAHLAPGFSELIKRRTFSWRTQFFVEKSKHSIFHIDLARDNLSGNFVGYCVASLTNDKIGEIESVFIEKEFRGQQVGAKFMERALAWMEKNGVQEKKIGVAAGNEQVFPFYEKYNFYPRVTILKQINPDAEIV